MADNVISQATTVNGATWRSYAEAGGVEHAAQVVEYVTTLSTGANVLQPVLLTNGLPVQPQTGVSWAVTVAALPALPLHQSTNVDQWNGTATDTNSGVKSAGTLRVVLATDQPALTNKLLVTPDSVALPANQSVNDAQLAGTTTDTNSGVKSAGTLRVVLATDQPALTNKLLVTPDSVALPANQSVNVAQINGVTATMGNGISGTGVLRVTVASDSTGQTTANAGTNLNTSALALEGGGNLATLAGGITASKYQINNAQINGVAPSMGNGISGTGVQRVTLASDSTGQVVLAAGAATIGALTANQSVNAAQVGGTATDTNSGVKSAGTLRVVLATDQPALTNKLLVTPDSVALPANQSVNVSQFGGTNAVTGTGAGGAGIPRVTVSNDSNVLATQSGTWNVGTVTTVTTVSTVTAVTAITNALPAGTNTIGGTSPVAATTGGATPYSYVAAASANQDSQSVKGSAGTVYSVAVFNVNAAVRYLKVYDKATAPTSADTPIQRYTIPGNATGAGLTLPLPVGMLFANGIGFRITTGAADGDTGAASANDVVVNLTYK